MQWKKLAVLGNICFWLTLIFQFWEGARSMQADLLNTIVMLGILSVVFNIAWLLNIFIQRNKSQEKLPGTYSIPTLSIKNSQTPQLLLTCFIILSFSAQLIFLYLQLL